MGFTPGVRRFPVEIAAESHPYLGGWREYEIAAWLLPAAGAVFALQHRLPGRRRALRWNKMGSFGYSLIVFFWLYPVCRDPVSNTPIINQDRVGMLLQCLAGCCLAQGSLPGYYMFISFLVAYHSHPVLIQLLK